jgi:hypothetical protein
MIYGNEEDDDDHHHQTYKSKTNIVEFDISEVDALATSTTSRPLPTKIEHYP